VKTRGTGVVGYNVQVAVDAKHHLIVAHEVTNNGIDRDQLTSMAKHSRNEMGVETLTAVADRGYYKSEEILACHQAGIAVFVSKMVTSSATAQGRFSEDDFIYNAEANEYRCPAGERLIWRYMTIERELKLNRYRPGKSALDAVGITRKRCWKYDWVLEFDLKGLFDNIDHDLLQRALVKHVKSDWAMLYIDRWLKAPPQLADGTRAERTRGTPQGGVVTPWTQKITLVSVMALRGSGGLGGSTASAS
jgi:hypothetical protein